MDQPKIERVLRLMKMLTANTNYTINDLAERLGTSYRSIYRYIDTFKEAGFVVQKHGDIYRLGKESKYFKDISQLIHFTDEEAYIVNNLIDALDDTNLLKQNLRKKLASIYNCTTLADCVIKGKNAINIHAIIEAIQKRKQVMLINYSSSHTGKIRNRHVEPFAFTTNYIEIWCYDLEDSSNKLFKSARIDSVEILDDCWSAESNHRTGYIDIFRMSGYKQHHIKIELGVMAHNLLLEEYPIAERDINQIAPNKWLLDTMVTSYSGVARFVIGLADDICIVETPKLQEYIHKFAKKYIK